MAWVGCVTIGGRGAASSANDASMLVGALTGSTPPSCDELGDESIRMTTEGRVVSAAMVVVVMVSKAMDLV